MQNINDDVGESTRLKIWQQLLKLRLVEKKAYDLFLENLIKGTSHLSLGQEAIGSAFGVVLEKNDFTFCTYRGHAHTLSRGASIVGVLGELMGRECGLMRGKGGSMHLTDVKNRVMGSYAIVGAHLPIANGTAWASQYNNTGAVTTCFLVMVQQILAPFMKRSIWPRYGICQLYLFVKTIFIWNTRP
jgi:TPP-dependent pyruvate/acetoin dehydrogenase alpha subunit